MLGGKQINKSTDEQRDLYMINKKREKLIDFGISLNNLTDSRLIKMSQELDVMIVEYQRVLLKN